MIKSKLFIKYITSYIILLLIPILILGFIISDSYVSFLNREITTSNLNLLEQSRDSLDSKINELHKLSIQISNNPYLTNSYLADNMPNVISSTKLLKSFAMPNNFYEQFYINYFDNDLIYSPTGTYTTNYFFNTVYRNEAFSFQKLKEILLNHPGSKTISLESIGSKYFMHIEPLPYLSEKPYGTVFFMIPYSSFEGILSGLLGPKNGSVLIMDSNSKIIAAFGNKGIDLDNISISSLKEDALTQKIMLNNEQFFISSIKSRNSDWRYIALIPANKLTSELTHLKNVSAIAFTLIFFIGFILIYFLMHINYRPLHELTRITSKILGAGETVGEDIKSVQIAVTNMDSKIRTLENYVESSMPAMRNKLLVQLVKGSFIDLEDFNLEGKRYGIYINGPYLSAQILLFNKIPKDIKPKIASVIQGISMEGCEIHLVDTLEDSEIVLILSCKDPYESLGISISSLIQESILEEFNLNCCIGIGNWVSVSSDLAKSYLQAHTSLDYRLIKGSNKIIQYNDIVDSDKNPYFYPRDLIDLLEKQLSSKDSLKVSQTLSQIINTIKENNMPLISARLLCYNLVQLIFNAIYKQGYVADFDSSSYPDIMELARFDTVEDLADQIQRLYLDIFSRLPHTKESSNKQIQKIKKYIADNYLDPNFSIQTLSDNVDMSMSYMSRYFKANENENISDYVNRLRMDKAKELLAESDLDLKDIAATVGYLNLSSFIRKFKQTTGVTPGAYRDVNSK